MAGSRAGKVLNAADLPGIFGLDLEGGSAPEPIKAASRKPEGKPHATKPKSRKKS
jgi:hypothetical protein